MFACQREKPGSILRGQDHNHFLNCCALLESTKRVNDDGDARDFKKLLGTLPAHPRALPGSSDDGDIHKAESRRQKAEGSKSSFALAAFRMKTRIASPGSTTGFNELASSLMLSTLTPRSWATLFKLKSLVTITASSCLPSSINFKSTSRTAGKSVSTI